MYIQRNIMTNAENETLSTFPVKFDIQVLKHMNEIEQERREHWKMTLSIQAEHSQNIASKTGVQKCCLQRERVC